MDKIFDAMAATFSGETALALALMFASYFGMLFLLGAIEELVAARVDKKKRANS